MGDFPSFVLLIGDGKPLCGGIILTELVILTAAHCVANLGSHDIPNTHFKIMAGDVSSQSENRGADIVYRTVVYTFIHPQYNESSRENDLGILILNSSLPIIGNLISDADLAVSDIDSGSICSVAGWGVIDPAPNITSKIRMTINVTISEQESCRSHYGNIIKDGYMFCAGNNLDGTHTCQSDSGNVLYCNDELVGVVVVDTLCGQSGSPGSGYLKISGYSDWINTVIKSVYPESDAKATASSLMYSLDFCYFSPTVVALFYGLVV